MRRYRYDYALTLDFSAPISRHTFLFRFRPPCDDAQQVWGTELWSEPASRLPCVRDAFGNFCACGYVDKTHQRLILRAQGEAAIWGGRISERCPAYYALPTPLTAAGEALREFASGLRMLSRPLDFALEAAERIRARVDYRPGSTSEQTCAEDAFSQGAGVCQDMAHILLSVLRARGHAARYVAGLIPGEGETHAWVELCDGSGFVGVDPTHLRPTDDSYLRVSVGRDSRDCAINRGVFYGCAQQRMQVHARMDEL